MCKMMAVSAIHQHWGEPLIPTFFNLPKQTYFVQCHYDIWLKLCYIHIIYLESMIAFGSYVYLMLTIDRFVAIVWALKYKTIMTKKKYLVYTLFLFNHHIIGFFITYMFFPNEEPWAKEILLRDQSCQSTNLINPIARYYMLAFITLLVVINIMLCITLVIYLCVTRQRRKSLARAGSGSDNLSKATNTLIFVSALYTFLYVQLMVITFLAAVNISPVVEYIREVVDHLFTLNNNINPIVYYVRMPDFRKGFHALLQCKGDVIRANSYSTGIRIKARESFSQRE